MTVTSFAQNHPISVASCLLSILLNIKHRGSSATLPEVSFITSQISWCFSVTEVSVIIETYKNNSKAPKNV